MSNMRPYKRIYNTIRGIYKPRYMALNVIAVLAYYVLYKILVNIRLGLNAPLVLVPDYIVYILIFTSSILLTLAIYTYKNRKAKMAGSRATAASGTATTFAGGFVASCGCTPSLTLGVFTTFLSASSAYALNNFISVNQIPLFSAIIAINIVMIGYYVNKLSKSYCKI